MFIFFRLKEIENNLVDLAKTQGMQLEELNELLEENRRINREMTVSVLKLNINVIIVLITFIEIWKLVYENLYIYIYLLKYL